MKLRFLATIPIIMLMAFIIHSSGSAAEGDIVFKRVDAKSTAAMPPAVFPHWFHRIRFKCYACHPTIFEMKAGANKITMDAITQDGKFCGTCHNGKTAWAVGFELCPKCHVQP